MKPPTFDYAVPNSVDEAVSLVSSSNGEAQVLAERVITKGRSGALHQRRQALALLTDKQVVRKLFDEIGQRYAERDGGCTRLIKLSPRRGDAAPMALLELV